MEEIIKKISELCYTLPEIKLAYLFGSRATGRIGKMSDYDLAFYLNEAMPKNEMFELKLILQDKISRALGTDNIDVVIFNLAESPELKYSIIKEGKLIYEQEPYRVIVEPRIYDEYFDFRQLLRRYKLTAT